MVVSRIVAALALSVGVVAAGSIAHADTGLARSPGVSRNGNHWKWEHDGGTYHFWSIAETDSSTALKRCKEGLRHLVQLRDKECIFVNNHDFKNKHKHRVDNADAGYFFSENYARG